MEALEALMYEKRYENLEVSGILRLVRRNWFGLAVFSLVTMLLACAYVAVSTPLFSVDGSLFMGDASTVDSAGSDINSLQFMQNFETLSDVETNVELLQSETLVEQAILETGFNAPVFAAGTKDMNFLSWFVCHGGRVQAYAPRPGDLQALFASLDVPGNGPRQFNIVIGGNGTYKINEPRVLGGDVEVLSGRLGQPASGGGLNLLLKPALPGAPPPGSVYTMMVSPAQAVYQTLMKQSALRISPGGTLSAPTKLVNLQLLSVDPYAGQSMLNQLMSDFIASQLSWKTSSASATEDFIAGQLKSIQADLLSADQNLADYQSQTGIIDVPDAAKTIIGQLAQYETQLTGLQVQQEALLQLSDDMKANSGRPNPFLVGQSSDPVLGQLATSLAAAQAQLGAENVQFTSKSPELQVQQATVGKLEDSIRALVSNDLRLTSANLQQIGQTITQLKDQLRTMPAESLHVIALNRDSDVYGQLYVLLMQKAEEAAVSKAATLVNSRVVVPAMLPLKASQPRPKEAVLAGFLAGLVGGTIILLWRQGVSGRFETDDEIRRDVQLPVHGMIPARSRRDGKHEMVCSKDEGPFVEAFRFLRGNLPEPAPDGMGMVILVTSAQAGDGKTTVAANLARCFAASGKRALLVDADMRIHATDKPLKPPPDGGGLSEWLKLGREPALKQLDGPNLMYLPAGAVPPRPAELLESQKFGEIIKGLRQYFDVIVLDSPPLPAVSDGMILARHADLLLSVLRLGHSGRRAVWHHVQALMRLKKPQALVVNGMVGEIFGYGYGPSLRSQRIRFPRWHAE